MLYLFLLCTFSALSPGEVLPVKAAFTPSDTISYKIYDTFEALEKEVFQTEGETIKVINFWATWCGPCVKELPYFEKLNSEGPTKNIEVVLVSLDFKNQLKRRLDPFLEKHQIKSEVVVLADGNANNWIDKIDPSWSGTIPATLVIKGDQKIFAEQEFNSPEEIYAFIKQLK